MWSVADVMICILAIWSLNKTYKLMGEQVMLPYLDLQAIRGSHILLRYRDSLFLGIVYFHLSVPICLGFLSKAT